MNPNIKGSELISVLKTLDPVSQSAATVTTGWIQASIAHRFLAIIQTGVLGASATVDAKFQQASDSSGTGAKDVSGTSLTQIVKATGDNKQALINLSVNQLDTEGGFSYIRLSLTVGTAASLVSAVVLGIHDTYMPATDWNQTAVAQTVN